MSIVTIYISTGKEKKTEKGEQKWIIEETVKFESGIDKYREIKLIWLESGLSNR